MTSTRPSPTRAYLWELWHTSRLALFGHAALTAAFMMLLSTILHSEYNEPTRQLLRGLMLAMLVPGHIFSPRWPMDFSNPDIGFRFRSGFIQPVTTRWLALIPIAFATTMAVVTYWLQVGLFRILTGDWLPLLVPSALIAGGVTWLLAAIWVPTSRGKRALAIGTLIVAMAATAYWFHSQRTDGSTLLMAMGQAEYFSLSWQQVAVGMALVVAAVAATVMGVERQRHGDQCMFRRHTASTSHRRFKSDLLPAWPQSKHQALKAQFWFEWKRCRTTMLAASLIAPVLLFLLQTVGPMLGENWRGGEEIWLGALLVCPFAYQLLATEAALGLGSEKLLSQFDLTRALRCDQIMTVKILAVFVNSLEGWFIMAIAVSLHSLTGQTHTWTLITELLSKFASATPPHWWLACGLSLILINISSTAMLFTWLLLADRYPKWVWGAFIVGFSHIVLLMEGARNHWQLQPLWIAYGYIGTLIVVVASAFMFWSSFKSKAMGHILMTISVSLWLVYVVSIVSVFANLTPPTPIPLAATAFGAACLLVPLVSIVISPLALASHRNA